MFFALLPPISHNQFVVYTDCFAMILGTLYPILQDHTLYGKIYECNKPLIS